jgi:hypothetical protein
MDQEAPDELIGGNSHQAGAVPTNKIASLSATMLRGVLIQSLPSLEPKLSGGIYSIRKEREIRVSHPSDCLRKFRRLIRVDVECVILRNQQAVLFCTSNGRWTTL